MTAEPSRVGQALLTLANPEKANFLIRFFRCGPGEYAEGDQFLGITVPDQRQIAKNLGPQTTLPEIRALLESQWHEFRMTGYLILILQFTKVRKNRAAAQPFIDFYLATIEAANNWDLVDLSSTKLLGEWLLHQPRAILRDLAGSGQLWKERVAVVATLTLVRAKEFDEALELCQFFLKHRHDLLHKACGWVLREIGKRDLAVFRAFLDRHQTTMPRTMLRYAIEKLAEPERRDRLAAGRTA